MSSFDFLRTSPHVMNLKFGTMLVLQYEGRRERIAKGEREGFDVSPERNFLQSRSAQYEEARELIEQASLESLGEALQGIRIGAATRRRLRAAGLLDKVEQARRLSGS